MFINIKPKQGLGMRYEVSAEWTEKARAIARQLGFLHIPAERVHCILSRGSKTRRTIARIHGLPKAIQLGAGLQPVYVIELILEKFGRQSGEEQVKTIIHELMHIPHNFGGGFRNHRQHVNHQQVEETYRRYVQSKTENP